MFAKIPATQTQQRISLSDASTFKMEKKLSLHFKDIPIRDLLELLAEFNDTNLVLSDTIQGNITLHLEKVTWQQALDTILNIEGLGMRQEGKILFISSAQEITTRESNQLNSRELKTILIPIHYAKASDLRTLLQDKSGHLLSERGSLVVDDRTNQLWVEDTPDRLAQIHQFLKGIDIPAKQVQISARIVTVDEKSVKELGLQFGSSSGDSRENTGDNLHRDIPMTIENVGHFAIAIARLGSGNLLDLQISALEQNGHAKTLSNPQLVTANRQAASIESGQEVPYQESTSSGATNTSFKKAVLSLQVTPEITPENKVLLNLEVNQDKVDTLTINGVPAINTQKVKSQVLLNNGETIVLGGIYEENKNQTDQRVPFWNAIPIIGKLFANHQTSIERTELLIFVTPKMITT